MQRLFSLNSQLRSFPLQIQEVHPLGQEAVLESARILTLGRVRNRSIRPSSQLSPRTRIRGSLTRLLRDGEARFGAHMSAVSSML